MEALIRELKEQAKDHIKLGDDYNVAFGRGMGKAIYAIKQFIELDNEASLQIDCEPLSFVTKGILKDVSKRIKKTRKKKEKQYLMNQNEDFDQMFRIELMMKSLESFIIHSMLETGKEFDLEKVIDTLKSL